MIISNMNYYADEKGEVFAYAADGSQDHLIGNKRRVTLDGAAVLSKDDHYKAKLGISSTYAEKRASFYPDIGDQLDALWHAMDNGTLPMVPAFYDPISAIKQEYPKE